MKRILQEGVLVAVIGAALAFAANALSPRGLKLTENYFPGTALTVPVSVSGTNAAGAIVHTNSPAEQLAALLRTNGLQLADSNLVVQLFHDPRRQVDGVIFVDARDDEHYRAGHIPGAYHFDRFHPENYITNVLQPCLTAQEIIFYCNGGECDDSLHAALYLRDSLSLPKEKVFVYGGGMTEWAADGLPIELGARNSGQFTNLVKTATSNVRETSRLPQTEASK